MTMNSMTSDEISEVSGGWGGFGWDWDKFNSAKSDIGWWPIICPSISLLPYIAGATWNNH